MKILEHCEVPVEELPSFLSAHIDEALTVKECTDTKLHITIAQDYTEPELHMFHLRKFIESGDATPEEQNAAEYAINAIKTLMDMGVLK